MTNCGTSLSCICASSIGTELQSCMNCIVAAEPSDSTEANSAIESWNEACGGSLTLTSGSTSTSTTTSKGSTATTTSSGSSSPFTSKTGDAVGMKTAIGALGLVVAIACGIMIL
ncbi:uncharacterized protein BJ212DRAFT_1322545 [Suillus subaureus]|uniref:Uncharacterized protein n=1 Tax=Suillus subaureus TaxID=48587 RepID=A0A9P7EKW9_9AGAM|nr:uncharacterized protein BJ212DRAFT_1322545 [Suillus subaureus]KAG1824811.1 hypothetical protein BJ212DRAFT_1322545 [Suillus subaureus]